VLGSQAYLGFTAGTGGLTNVHEILDWEFSSNSELLPAPATPLSLIGENVVSGLIQPTAVDWSPDGEVMYVSEQRGVVKAFRDGTQSTFVDFTDEVNGTRDRGLLDIAVHPDFENNPYVYLLYTYDPPEVYDNLSDNLAGPDENGNRAGRLTRVTADVATN
jgi:glucose/arabinose dehydrogenase